MLLTATKPLEMLQAKAIPLLRLAAFQGKKQVFFTFFYAAYLARTT
jgi:hypothetical protein